MTWKSTTTSHDTEGSEMTVRVSLAAEAGAIAQPIKREPIIKIVAAYLLCASIWGTTWFAIRTCVQPGAFQPFAGAALRFVLTVAIFGSIWFALRRRFAFPSADKIRWIALAGCCAGLGYGLLYFAEQQVSGGLAAVISASTPLMVAVIAMATKTERPTGMTIVGAVLAVAGVAIVFHDRMQVSPGQAMAVSLMILNCCVGSASNVVLKRHVKDVPSLVANTIFFIACTILLLGGALVSHQAVLPNPVPPAAAIALVYLSVFGTVCTFAAWLYLLKHVRLSTGMTLSFIIPIIALIVDSFLEKQTVLRAETYLGIAFVLAGVAATILLKFKANK